MGYHMSANISIGVRSFSDLCEYFYLPAPKYIPAFHNGEEYDGYYVIDWEMYKEYKLSASVIYDIDRIKNREKFSLEEVHFGAAMEVINQKFYDWLYENDKAGQYQTDEEEEEDCKGFQAIFG